MIRTFPELPEWTFDIDETSAGVYQVIAKNKKGRVVTRVGTDPELLISECKREAAGKKIADEPAV